MLSSALLQLNIILKNSGTYEGIVSRIRHELLGIPWDRTDDAILKLQFLARLAIQYDLADLAALLSVPAMISCFVLRDGYFSIEGSGILVLSCDLVQLWAHFALLVVIKPAAFYVARKILERKMARALLGQRTIHGTSALAAEFMVAEKERIERKKQSHTRRSQSRRTISMRAKSRRAGGDGKDGRAKATKAKIAPAAQQRGQQPTSASQGRPPASQQQQRQAGQKQQQAQGQPAQGQSAQQLEKLAHGQQELYRRSKGDAEGGKPNGIEPLPRILTCATARQRVTRERVLTAGGSIPLTPPAEASFSGELCKEDGQRLNDIVISHVGDDLGFGEERKHVLASEFEISNLNYRSLFNRTIRRSYRFFAAAVLFELFAVLPRHMTVPTGAVLHGGAPIAHASFPLDASRTHVPVWAAWLRMPAATEFALDEPGRLANLQLNASSSCVQAAFG